MIEKIKLLLGRYILHKKLNENKITSFKNFFTDSVDYFIILPEDDESFKNSLTVVQFLLDLHKNITLFVVDFRKNLIPDNTKHKIVSFEAVQKSKLNLPKQELIEQINKYPYDIVIDLNRGNNIFYSAIANFVKSKYRVGFNKEYAELYYNFLVLNDKINSDISYKNLLNSLKMF